MQDDAWNHLYEQSLEALKQSKALWSVLEHKELTSQAVKLCQCSPFALHLLTQSTDWLLPLIENDIIDCNNRQSWVEETLPLHTLHKITDEANLHQALRKLRQMSLFMIMWRETLGQATLEETIQHLSHLADHCLQAAYQWHYQQLSQQLGQPIHPETQQPVTLLILGMGKLGGNELNFSSDIDLIFFYDAPSFATLKNGRLNNEQFFTRLGQKIITAIDKRTADGFVFRVDMRLRPYGDSGPLVMSLEAAEEYYQNQGREWERYAMLKSRVITGTPQEKQVFYQLIKPFIYRRYIDFGVLESLRQMKFLIRKEALRKNLDTNIKLGSGGIREIEFICQSLQLIQGGRNNQLQTQSLYQAYAEILIQQLLPEHDIQQLLAAYEYLRRLEHALQLIRDEQTQTLPSDELDQYRVAHLMRLSDYDACLKELDQHRTKVQQLFSTLIEEETHEEDPDISPLKEVWHQVLLESDAVDELRKLGFDDASQALNHLYQFRHSAKLKTLGEQGRKRLSRLIPVLLFQIKNTDNPDITLKRIIHLLQAISGRTAYLALLDENPQAVLRLIHLCSQSAWISAQLAQYPILLDETLDHRIDMHPFNRETLEDEIQQALVRLPIDDIESQMDALRQIQRSIYLRVASAEISNSIDTVRVADHLTDLAEILLEKVTRIAWHELTQKYGQPQNKNGLAHLEEVFAIIGYGKLGSYEMGYGSDVDIVFLHQLDNQFTTTGPKVLSSSQFILKLGQRIMYLMGLRTRLGRLYEVDTRLRPSGNSGLLVSQFDAYRDYQVNEAWNWEHQALTRARCVFGDKHLKESFNQIKKTTLMESVNREKLAENIVNMRTKMRANVDKSDSVFWDPKQGQGGLVDIEFLMQYWVLKYCQEYPQILEETSNRHWLKQLYQYQRIDDGSFASIESSSLSYRQYLNHCQLQEKSALAIQSQFMPFRQVIMALWEYHFSGE
ncbi:MAG: bifunctional [glutamate--ammonia ligase]-adenylyl-L-tyrosine phosphorylase/[glutamate--ammonia-ligase] adenylyltransferase [Pseudomonadota bacterium]